MSHEIFYMLQRVRSFSSATRQCVHMYRVLRALVQTRVISPVSVHGEILSHEQVTLTAFNYNQIFWMKR